MRNKFGIKRICSSFKVTIVLKVYIYELKKLSNEPKKEAIELVKMYIDLLEQIDSISIEKTKKIKEILLNE